MEENKEYIELGKEEIPTPIKEEPTAHEEVEKPDREQPQDHKELQRLKRNEYYRDYYHRNKHKPRYRKNKYGEDKKRVGERGKNLNMKYLLSVIDTDTGNKLISQKFKTLYDISDSINLPQYTVRLIANGKYKGDGARQKKTKKYQKFLIERL
jgi:hypothetical protein